VGYIASIKVEKQTEKSGKKLANLFLGVFMLRLVFDPEDRGDIFLRNVGRLLPNYTSLHPGI
jgi:hypothetical protein